MIGALALCFLIASIWVAYLSSRVRTLEDKSATVNEIICRKTKECDAACHERDRLLEMIQEKALTHSPKKAQDTPKKLSGAQLRRMAEHENAVAFPPERPNSDILQEQENG